MTTPAANGVRQTTSYVTSVYGNVTQITYPGDYVVDMAYDARGNQIKWSDSLGNLVTRSYDSETDC